MVPPCDPLLPPERRSRTRAHGVPAPRLTPVFCLCSFCPPPNHPPTGVTIEEPFNILPLEVGRKRAEGRAVPSVAWARRAGSSWLQRSGPRREPPALSPAMPPPLPPPVFPPPLPQELNQDALVDLNVRHFDAAIALVDAATGTQRSAIGHLALPME